jgi:hypothetical protein
MNLRRLAWWLYPVGIAVLVASVIWALHLPPRLLMCADHSQDGGVDCVYGSVVEQRIATIGVGLAIALSICGAAFVTRHET